MLVCGSYCVAVARVACGDDNAGVIIRENERELSVKSRESVCGVVVLVVYPNLIAVLGVVRENGVGLFGVGIGCLVEPVLGENTLAVINALVEVEH